MFKILLDLGPLGVFFLAYKTWGLMAATGAIVACTLASLAITYAMERKIAVMPLVTAILVSVLGALTLWLHNDQFIKMKPTLVNALFATVLLGGLYFNKPMIRYVLSPAFELTERGWRILSRRWGFYFIGLAVLNECIWRNFSTDFWVNFKVFGMLCLTILFTFAQIPLIRRHWVDQKPAEAP